jgi:uncharacterized membrane protein YqgA involved in biofilm formation
MFGTFVNSAAILVGGAAGLLLRRGLSKQFEETALRLVGLGVVIVGLNGILSSMMTADSASGRLSDSGGIVLILSLVIGGLSGEWLDIDGKIIELGAAVERRLGAEGFAKGFVAASLLFCIGAMAIVGSLNDGLLGDSSILLIKSTLDGITAIVLASSLGYGVVFSAVSVFLYQGAITMGASFLAPVLSDRLLDLICMVGFCIVLVIGTNLMGLTRYKTANMLPCLLVPIAYNFVTILIAR